MTEKRTIIVYILLALVVLLSAIWQLYEHTRVIDYAKSALRNRGRDISNSVGVVIRSTGRFGFIPQSRLEEALDELTKSEELLFVALLNAAGEVTASAGEHIEVTVEKLPESSERWEENKVMFVNLVDFGPREGWEELGPTIVLPPRDRDENSEDQDEGSEDRDPGRPPEPPEEIRVFRSIEPDKPLSDDQASALKTLMDNSPLDSATLETLRSIEAGGQLTEEQFSAARAIARIRRMGRGRRGRGDGRGGGRGRRGPPPFRRPPWMGEEEHKQLLEKQGVHAFVLSMSTEAVKTERNRDFWLRMMLTGIAFTAAAGMGVAWYNFERSSRLEMRLLKAREMNIHLQEMNVAAAGLAHETRNPLNIIRGLAQMISKNTDASTEISGKSCAIAEEVDRVTGRLNQFMEYSRPLEAKPAPTDLCAVIGDVARALESDREDKAILYGIEGPELTVEADESLLRQVLFNLLLNAVQIVDHGGEVLIRIEKDNRGEVIVDVCDDGPGVAEDAREEIFKPYYTTSEQGTGLGLAVVWQIVLAHHWEIEYIPGTGGGSVFRLSGIKAI